MAVVVDRMRMPPTYDVLAVDEKEEEFQVYRRSLRQLLESISSINQDLVLSYIHAVVEQTLQNLAAVDFTRAELVCFLLNCVGDGIRGT